MRKREDGAVVLEQDDRPGGDFLGDRVVLIEVDGRQRVVLLAVDEAEHAFDASVDRGGSDRDLRGNP
ncbi:MAG: hypothetical protein MZW92_02600 [Comamonadaceae bacterium]|nr:hypothetical protein [Comamonadaceae bacterium]